MEPADPAPSGTLDHLTQDLEKAVTATPRDGGDLQRRVRAAAAFASAQQLESQGKIREALDRYLEAAAHDPSHSAITIRHTLLLLRTGDNQQALTILEKRLEHEPEQAEFHSLSAFCHEQLGNAEKAVEHARISHKLNPSLLSNYRILVPHAGGTWNPQLEALLRAGMDSASDDAVLLTRMANLWMELGSNAGWITMEWLDSHIDPVFARATAADPSDIFVNLNAGDYHFRRGRFEQAAALFDKAWPQARRQPMFRERYSHALIAAENWGKAAEVLADLLIDEPTRNSLHRVAGEMYGRAGQWEASADHLSTYVLLETPDEDVLLRLAEAQVRAERIEQSLATLANAQKRFPLSGRVAFVQALVLQTAERHDDALGALLVAEQLAVDTDLYMNDEFYFRRAVSHESTGRWEEAVEDFRKVLEIEPDHHLAMNNLGYLWAERDIHIDEAHKLLTRALELEPNQPAYLDSMGWIYYRCGEFEKARDFINRALQDVPDDPVVNDHMGDILVRLGKLPEALEHWKKALPKAPNPAEIRSKLEQHGHTNHANLTPQE